MNLNQIKVMMFDMDGTFVLNGSQINHEVIEAFKTLRRKGYILCINSGRPYFMILRLLDSYNITDLFDYIFACNGSELYLPKTDELKCLGYLKSEIIKEVSNLFKNNPIAISIITSSKLYIDRMISQKAIDRYCNSRNIAYEVIDFQIIDHPESKLLGLVDEGGYDKIKAKITDIQSPDYDLFFSSKHLLEIVSKGVNKGYACKKLKEALKLDSKNILSFGDEENDLSMFDESVSVAIGKGNVNVTNQVDYISDDAENNGVVSFLKMHNFI